MPSSNKTVMLFFPGPLGGAEMVVAQGFKALLELGLNIELWIIGESRALHAINQFQTLVEGLPTKTFYCESIIDFKLMRELSVQFKNKEISLIHAHGFKACVYAKITRAHQKLILTHHGKTAHTLKVRIYEFIEEMIMRRADRVISVSQGMKDVLAKKAIESILIENFLTMTDAPQSKKGDLPLKFIFVGRLSPEKGCRYLVEAMKDLANNNISLTIVGDGIERDQLQRMANPHNTQFLGFRKDISELLNQHHILVMPSLREGLPLTLIEATCNGLPVIATNVGGIPSLITHQLNGILIPPADVSELKKAIIEMRQKLGRFSNNAQALAPEFKKRFSSKQWAKKTAALYSVVNHE